MNMQAYEWEQDCEWFLFVFDRHTEVLVTKYPLPGFNAATVHTIFELPPEIPPIGDFDVGLEHISQLQRYTDAEFDTQKYLYQVGCRAV